MKRINIRVPASIGNMGSGFDCAGMSLKLYNEFTVEKRPVNEIILANKENSVSVKKLLSLFLRAQRSAYRDDGLEEFNVAVTIKNRIPFRRGMGSSATVVLAGIISGLLFSGKKINKRKVLSMALPFEGHIDNLAASLYGGFVIGTRENLQVISVPVPKSLSIIACIPDRGLSTKSARSVLPEKVSMNDAVYNLSSFGFLCAAFMLNNPSLLEIGLNDRLHQPYRESLIPSLKILNTGRLPAPLLGGALSGAGPSLIFFSNQKDEKTSLEVVKKIIVNKENEVEIRILTPGGKTLWRKL